MSIVATQWAWTQENLRPARKLVLLSLADRAGERHTCWPSLGRLAVDTGLNPKTIRAALADLCAAGLIMREATPGRSHTYTLCRVAAWLEEKAAVAVRGENNPHSPRIVREDACEAACAKAHSPQVEAPFAADESRLPEEIISPGGTVPSCGTAPPGKAGPSEDSSSTPAQSYTPGQITPPCQNPAPGTARNSPLPSRLRQGRGAGNGSLTGQEPDTNQAVNRKAPSGPRKQPFGRFGNVLLTPEERQSLAGEHGAKADRAIDKLDLWLGAHGDRYKSHFMAIHAWVLRAVDEDDARAAPAPAIAPARDQARPQAILPTTYAHMERANQKSVARLALLGRGVIAHGRQTSHHHGIDPDPDPVQPPRG